MLKILEMAPGSSGPPKLNGRNYNCWKARMTGYLEALHVICWEVTEKPIVGHWSEDQIMYHARAKNALFDALTGDFLGEILIVV